MDPDAALFSEVLEVIEKQNYALTHVRTLIDEIIECNKGSIRHLTLTHSLTRDNSFRKWYLGSNSSTPTATPRMCSFPSNYNSSCAVDSSNRLPLLSPSPGAKPTSSSGQMSAQTEPRYQPAVNSTSLFNYEPITNAGAANATSRPVTFVNTRKNMKMSFPFLLGPVDVEHVTNKDKKSRIHLPSLINVTREFLQIHAPELLVGFIKMTAMAKGHLIRQMLRSYKVRHLWKNIKDCVQVAKDLNKGPLPTESSSDTVPETAAKLSSDEEFLRTRVIQQLALDLDQVHEIFFKWPVSNQMSLVASTRQLMLQMQEKFSAEAATSSAPPTGGDSQVQTQQLLSSARRTEKTAAKKSTRRNRNCCERTTKKSVIQNADRKCSTN